MSLTAEDLQSINQHFTTWFEEANQRRDPSPFELRQEERLGRLDDTLQRLSGVVQHGFSQVDKRLDQVDKRLDQVDKRLDQVELRLDQVDLRLDQVDKRFDRNEIRYTGFDGHFQAINQRIDRFMFFSLGLTVTVGMAVVTLVQMLS
jgi:tetrahydromethanopterin S-methyltransferase subunit G